MNGNTIGEQDDFEATRDRILRDAWRRETKAEKAERFEKELLEHRVETLQNAARILEQLDGIIGNEVLGLDSKTQIFETRRILIKMAEDLQKAPRWKNSSPK